MDLKECKIYLVTDEKSCKGKDFYSCIEEAIESGVKIVQLREKIFLQKISMRKPWKLRKFVKAMKYYS